MKKKWIAVLLALALCAGCTACSANGSSSAAASAETLSATVDDMFTSRDFEVGYSDYVTVTLADDASTADGNGVSISGNTVTVTAEGTYLLTGSLTNGQVIVSVPDSDKVQLVLDNVSITCSGGAAIEVQQADKVFLTMAEDSSNALSTEGTFDAADSSVDGVIFSKSDLTMNGSGTLTIETESGHGVVCKDDLKVTSGTYKITAASHGLQGKDSVSIAGGTFTITSGKDGIHAENSDDDSKGFVYLQDGSFTIVSTGDGISAASTLMVVDGSFTITTDGGSTNASTKSDGQPNGDWGHGTMTFDDSTASGSAAAPSVPDGNPGQMISGGTPPDQNGGQTPPAAASTAAADNDSTAVSNTENSEENTSAKGLKSGTGTVISGGTFTIDSANDSVHTNGDLVIDGGTFAISSGDDGMHADAALSIDGGSITVTKSYEGLEGATIAISGGTIAVTASDDGLNASGGSDGSSINGRAGQNSFDNDSSASIVISGGEITVDASGDGIDSNGDLTVSGGTIFVSGPTDNGNGALDYGGTGTITGGVVIAAGSTGMAQNFGAESTQCSILYNLTSEQEAGTTVTLTDSSGNVIASCTPSKQFQSVVISAREIESGSTYTLSAGSETESVEMADILYSNASSTMGGGMGGHGGMGGTAPDGNGGGKPSRGGTGSTTGAADNQTAQ